MIGIDTTWLVDLEVLESPRHEGAVRLFMEWRAQKHTVLLLYYHVLLEFQHIVTDARRFESPLSMAQAIQRSWFWVEQERVRMLYPNDQSFKRAQVWLSQFDLGRKRLIDTHMAASYAENGASVLFTANPGDFAVFKTFDLPGY